jgi:hypothetical protein
MSDSETSSREAAAELRITRVSALSDHDLVGVVTYLLAKHPDTFPPMLDDALSAVSPKAAGAPASGPGRDSAGEGRRES